MVNIITHPSSPRYKSLAEAIAALRLAEREEIDVDRMIADMLTLGRHHFVDVATAHPYFSAQRSQVRLPTV